MSQEHAEGGTHRMGVLAKILMVKKVRNEMLEPSRKRGRRAEGKQ